MTREEAINQLKDFIILHREQHGWDVSTLNALDMAIKALEQTRWIPVSEGLPEDKTYVLVTIAVRGRQPHCRSSWYQTGAFHNDNGDYWRADEPEVVAWMPLPESCEAESEDKE